MNIQELTELFDLSTSVDHATAVLQTKTCRQVIEMLQTIPGIIIGDDVGMGKTYIAISAALYFLDSYPNKKVSKGTVPFGPKKDGLPFTGKPSF